VSGCWELKRKFRLEYCQIRRKGGLADRKAYCQATSYRKEEKQTQMKKIAFTAVAVPLLLFGTAISMQAQEPALARKGRVVGHP
jgi:hypothetical protein